MLKGFRGFPGMLGKGEAGDLLDAQIVRRAVKAARALEAEAALHGATPRHTTEGGDDGEE